MNNKIRFAVVGCGRIGTRHCEEIFNNPDAELTIACDIRKEAADAMAKKHGCKVAYTFEDILKLPVDVVNICTPSGMHADMSIKALKAGKNVLCEKPMTLNLADAERVIAAEKSSGKKFFLVKQNRYNPPIKALKDAVWNRKLGKISLINCNVMWNRNEQYYRDSEWKGTMKLDGGALMTQCSHFLDLMLWIGGPVKSVYAKMENQNHSYAETEDVGILTIKFASGALGMLQYTTNVFQKNFEGTMTLLGTEGTIKVGGEYLNKLEYWNVQGHEQPTIEQGRGANDYGTYKGSMSNHDKVISNVVRALRGEEEIATNSVQGKESVEVMQAAYLSAAYNKEIRLPYTGRLQSWRIEDAAPISGKFKNT